MEINWRTHTHTYTLMYTGSKVTAAAADTKTFIERTRMTVLVCVYHDSALVCRSVHSFGRRGLGLLGGDYLRPAKALNGRCCGCCCNVGTACCCCCIC